jgi:hypothetical protein
MHTADDTAWLRSLSRGKRSLAGAAGTGLDGMRRAKASKAPAADGKGPGGMPDADSPAAGTRARARHACGRPRALALDALADGDAESPATADDLSAPPPPMTATTSAPLPSSGSMHGMTLTQLRDMARAHGIPAAGSKVRHALCPHISACARLPTRRAADGSRPPGLPPPNAVLATRSAAADGADPSAARASTRGGRHASDRTLRATVLPSRWRRITDTCRESKSNGRFRASRRVAGHAPR